MKPPPDEDPSYLSTFAGLVAVIVLVVLAVWVITAYRHSSDLLECLAAHRTNCAPVQ